MQDTHRYTEVLNRPDIKIATEITKIISDVCSFVILFVFFRHYFILFFSNFSKIQISRFSKNAAEIFKLPSKRRKHVMLNLIWRTSGGMACLERHKIMSYFCFDVNSLTFASTDD